jgi:hypothetical protein
MVYGCRKDGFKGWQGKERFEAVVSSFGEAKNGFGTIAADITAYSKKSFEDGIIADQKQV